MNCDMCGREDVLFRAVIEGTQLKVCRNCARFGKILEQVKSPEAKKKKKAEDKKNDEPEIIEVIIDDYASKVKSARERLGLKQEELALKMNEKESILHKVESGHFKPGIELAKKLEKFLKIRIVEVQEIEKQNIAASQSSGDGMTIGDIIKLKR